MGRTTDRPDTGGGAAGRADAVTIRRFYDDLAGDYDRMTGFESRFARERPWFEAIVSRYGIRTALDAGCGTGFHSIVLSQLGVLATGVDASLGMIRLAAANARRCGVAARFLPGEFGDLPGLVPGPYDAVFCLGNSLVHLLTDDGLDGTLRGFHGVLKPGGVTIAQVLNYGKILAERKAVVGRREGGGITYERRYEYDAGTIRFSVARVSGDARAGVPDSQSIPPPAVVHLRPLTETQLRDAFGRAGFVKTMSYGGLALPPFSPESSDLVVIAAKAA